MSLRIDARLNLVIPIERNDGIPVYVHAMPVSREVFESYHRVMSKAFSNVWRDGGVLSGPSVAELVLRDAAIEMRVWDTEGGVRDGLLAEIRRLANVAMPTANGWESVPFDEVVSRNVIDPMDIAEAMGSMVFFTLVSSVQKRKVAPDMLKAAGDLWGTQTTYSTLMEFIASLPTSKTDDSSGTQVAASSVPT